MPYIFAYGSNMLQAQMLSRCPSAVKIQNHRIEGYKFTLPRYDEEYGGGVAGIIKNENAYVEGVIYSLSKDDLHVLDGFECVEQGAYTRETITQIMIDENKVEVDAHIATIMNGFPFIPPPDYAERILKGALENNLPQSYIDNILKPILQKACHPSE